MTRAKSTTRGWILAALSSVGLVATFWQTAEKIQLLKHPEDPLSCNINPIVDCGSVLNDSLSAVFGVPNAMLGMVAFSLLLMLGLVMAIGVKPNLWFKRIVIGLSLAMFAFSIWFLWASFYAIGKVCIFCIFIWASTFALTVFAHGWFGGDVYPRNKLLAWKFKWFEEKPWQPIVVLYLIVLILFIYRFRDYYFN